MKIYFNGENYEPNHFRMILQVKGDENELEKFDKFMYVCKVYEWDFGIDGKGFPWSNGSMFLIENIVGMYDNLMRV